MQQNEARRRKKDRCHRFALVDRNILSYGT